LNSPSSFVRGATGVYYQLLQPANAPYWLMYFLLVIAFTYFYTDVIFRQQNLAETLQRQGGFIPGHPAGHNTEKYLNTGPLPHHAGWRAVPGVRRDPALAGASGVRRRCASNAPGSTLLISSTGLLIVVGVVLDTMKQLEAQLLMRHYEGFIRK
jgi:preprotein translocase subunit SecY